jgi:putative aldouronate transport system substrate-binding protein
MPNSHSGLSRRGFLAPTAVAAAATAGGVPLLSAGGGKGSSGQEGRVSEDELRSILPTYQASDAAVDPDIASVLGSNPGYTRWIPQEELGASVPEPRGGGAELTVMIPLWGTPPRRGNAYGTAMDEGIGVRMTWRIQDGNIYGEKLAAPLAGSDIPDLVCIPDWEFDGQVRQAISSRFADLAPFLSGDRVLDYPNLAAIPTEAWRASVFGGALRGLPMPQNPYGGSGTVLFYRQDIFDANGWTQPGSAQEFYDFCVEITNARDRVWAVDDPLWFAERIYGVLPENKPLFRRRESGRLINRVETEGFLEALEWTRSLCEAGWVHPDAIAATGDAAVRFAAGECLMYIQGSGNWYPAVSEQQATNPDFHMKGMDFFAADGGDPVLWTCNGASIWTFVNENLSKERIWAALELANFTAAAYGIEGTHYTLEDGLPVRTEQGNAEVVQEAYVFICSPESVVAYPDLPQVVEDFTAWQQRNLAFAQDPVFIGRQVQEPARLAGIPDGLEDLVNDVVRGRQSIRVVRNAVDEWRRNGGDELRDFYQRILNEGEGGRLRSDAPSPHNPTGSAPGGRPVRTAPNRPERCGKQGEPRVAEHGPAVPRIAGERRKPSLETPQAGRAPGAVARRQARRGASRLNPHTPTAWKEKPSCDTHDARSPRGLWCRSPSRWRPSSASQRSPSPRRRRTTPRPRWPRSAMPSGRSSRASTF